MSDHDDRVATLAGAQMAKLAQRYVALRQQKAELNKELNERLAPIDDAMDVLSRAMLAKLNAEGATSQRTPHGTAYVATQSLGTIVDRDVLWKFMVDNNVPELLQNRLTLSEVIAYNEANPDAPVQGVQLSTVKTVQVRAK
jgi:hypothetical protein